MWKEFKEFIFTGNVIDFAIAVILAGAVGLVVNGFVNDIIMPIVGNFAGGVDFADKMLVLGDKVNEDGSPANAIRYGKWFNTIINLIIVGFVLFMLGKAKIKFMGAAPDPDPTADQALLAEIRDALKK
jgi:large conductance mechanosensitive channel